MNIVMAMKKFFAILALLLSLSLVACKGESAPAADRIQTSSTESATSAPAEIRSDYGIRVDEEVLICRITPAEGERVRLISEYTNEFVTDYYFGKGPDSVSNKNAAMSKKGAMHQEVLFSWNCTAENATFTLAYATQADFSDAKTLETDKTEVTITGLHTASAYYWQVVTHTEAGENYSAVFSFRTEDTVRIIQLDGADNTRDLGGYLTVDGKFRVRQGMVYRGSNLDGITGTGMKQAVEFYGIKTDLDLRSPGSESDNMLYKDKSPILMGQINYINIPGVSYSSALPYSSKLKEELLVFANADNYPIYFHCLAGRDRAGTLAFFLNALLGVPEEKLLMDYELTYLSPRAYAAGDMRGHDWMTEFLTAFKTLPGDTLQEKAESYCLGSGLTQEQIDTIREIMLEPVN